MNPKVLFFRAVSLLALLTIFGSTFAQSLCESDRHVHATFVDGRATICAPESTISSLERKGAVIRTPVPTESFPTELAARETISLRECEENHIKVRLVDSALSFCVTESIAKKWTQEQFAFEVDQSTISAPQIAPERSCVERIKVNVANGERIVCVLEVTAQKWLEEGFATEVVD